MNSERSLILLFLAFLVAIPVSQAVLELRRGERPQALALFAQKPTAPNLRAYERDLEDASQTARWARPWAQYAQFAWFKDGGEKVLLGRDGWLFYKPGVEYLTQRPGTVRENGTAAQALAAIVSLRNQLDARGIRLLVVPAPNKESVYPDQLTRRAERLPGVVCEETRTVLGGLRAAGSRWLISSSCLPRPGKRAPAPRSTWPRTATGRRWGRSWRPRRWHGGYSSRAGLKPETWSTSRGARRSSGRETSAHAPGPGARTAPRA